MMIRRSLLFRPSKGGGVRGGERGGVVWVMAFLFPDALA